MPSAKNALGERAPAFVHIAALLESGASGHGLTVSALVKRNRF